MFLVWNNVCESCIVRKKTSCNNVVVVVTSFNYLPFLFLLTVEDLSKLGTYGGNDSIVAFARNHGVNVVIHQLNEPRWVINGAGYSDNGQVIELHISYHNGEHYSSVRHTSDNSCEPAWIKHRQVAEVSSNSQIYPVIILEVS